MQSYKNYSFEVGIISLIKLYILHIITLLNIYLYIYIYIPLQELRLADYNIGRKFDAQRQSSGFGLSSGSTPAFGAQTTQPTVFGGASSTTSGGFGGSTGFGAPNTGSSTFTFGAQPAAPSTLGGGFGTGNTSSTTNLFGGNKFGAGTTGFGAATPTTGFGATAPAGGTTGFGASSN